MRLLFLITTCLLLISCNKKIDGTTDDTLKESIVEMKKSMDDDEVKKFEEAIQLVMIQNINFAQMMSSEDGAKENFEDIKSRLNGKTAKEIIKEAESIKEEQKKKEAEEKALAEKARLEELAKKERLDKALKVVLYNKGYDEYDYQDYLIYYLAFENKTEKDIRAFKGTLIINDLFDTEIKKINLTIDDPISAGQVFKGTYTTDYNQFISEDKSLRSKNLEDLKVVWMPEKIIFADGSTLD